MAKTTDAPRKKKGVSILNWMGTLVLTSIPGVNIIALIIIAAASKTRSKRTFAGAALILIGLVIALIVAAFAVFGAELVELVNKLKPAV